MKVALLGADGKLGPAILTALLAHNNQVTVLKRASSKSPDNYPAGVQVAKIQDDFDPAAAALHLEGHDAVIATIKGSQIDIQYRLAQACVQAGVNRFIPADFGSCDSSTTRAQELIPLFKKKDQLRKQLLELSEANPHFSSTNLVCGHFFDWSLDFLHIYLKGRRMDIIEPGDVKASYSTLARIGEATAGILENLKATKNRIIYVQSFSVSQDEILASFEKATGAKWTRNAHDAATFEREKKAKADAGDLGAVEDLVWYLGAVDGDWRGKDGFAMDLLGFKDEDLDGAVAECVKEFS